jgi:Fe-S-cluster containining protein
MSDLWYKKGLKFKCTECGACCTGTPGYVWASPEEIVEMAQFLKITQEEFLRRYTRQVGGRIALLERRQPNGDFDCIFLKERKCSLYQARPKQCRTYPWWNENLTSPAAWQEAAEICEGIDHPDAPLISLGEIQRKIDE